VALRGKDIEMSVEVLTLRDPKTGSEADILNVGFNCFSFRARLGGRTQELLWAAENFRRGTERPSGSGIPLLFPFAGRLRGQEFRYLGHTYPLGAAPGDGRGNAIHGFVLNRTWEIQEKTATRVVGRFQASRVDPEILRHWPADFILTAEYELRGNVLASLFTVQNPSARELPFAFGTHPYFRLPLGPDGTADQCRVTVPARARWELENLLPTGRVVPLGEGFDLRHGRDFADTQLDDVLTQLTSNDGKCVASLQDPRARRRLEIRFDATFRECVVYTPPHREAICIEPYTGVPDPFTLTAQGLETGLRRLAPHESWSTWVEMEAQELL